MLFLDFRLGTVLGVHRAYSTAGIDRIIVVASIVIEIRLPRLFPHIHRDLLRECCIEDVLIALLLQE